MNAYLVKVQDISNNGTDYEQGKLTGDIIFDLGLTFSGGGIAVRAGTKSASALSKIGALTKISISTSKIADRTVTIGGDVWKKGSVARGNTIDNALGNNLGHNFPVIDKLENGVITSIKSIDLTLPSYQTAKGIYSKLRRDVDELDDFKTKTWAKIEVTPERYSSKALEIVIPDMKITMEQQKGIEMVKEYAKDRGIETTVTVVK